jgi:WD40 repeat protein/serine/threonine protein kinase
MVESLPPSGASLPISLELRIDAICQLFEADWKVARTHGGRPRIEAYLNTVGEPERWALLRELLKVELHYRNGERAAKDEYRQRFRQFGQQLDEFFEQLTLATAPAPAAACCGETARIAPAHETGLQDPPRGAVDIPQPEAATGDLAAVNAALPSIPGYEIMEELGHGGMGVVYKARHIELSRIVALKMILAEEYAGEGVLARFRAEVEAVARIQHPNIVQIHEVGEHRGRPFCALEFISGGTLAARLAATPQPPRSAAALARTLALAMEAVHRQDIVHRDLKPANILLADSGSQLSAGPAKAMMTPGASASLPPLDLYIPKITDFGLVKLRNQDAGQTRTGSIIGTPAYMAPEQAMAKKTVGPAADVYALGVILYEMLVGQPPFKGATVLETLEQVCTREPLSPRLLQEHVPRDLETICLKCLEKGPGRRYPGAIDLAEDLRRFLEHKPVVARPVSAAQQLLKWIRRKPAVAALLAVIGVAVVALVGLGVALVGLGVASSYNSELRTAREATDVALKESERDHYIHRIGLAERKWWANNVGHAKELLGECPEERRRWEWFYLDRLCHSALRTLEGHTDEVWSVTVSPDGKYLVSGGWDHKIRLWDAETGRGLGILGEHMSWVYSVAFSPDGKRLASASGSPGQPGDVKVWDLEFPLGLGEPKGKEILRISDFTGENCQVAFRPPDGRELAVASGQVIGRPGCVRVLAVDHGGEKLLELDSRKETVCSVAFSPDGGKLACGRGATNVSTEEKTGDVQVWDLRSNRELRVLPQHNVVYCVAFSPDDKLLASAGSDNLVKLWDSNQFQEVRTLRGHTSAVRTLAFHLGGQQLVTASEDQCIKVWRAETGEELRTLRGHTGDVYSVAYYPDGQRLVSASADRSLRVWEPDLDQEALALRHHKAGVEGVAFSPDGRWLASASDDASVQLWDLDAAGKSHTLGKHDRAVWCVAFSPNGRWVASGSGDWRNTNEKGQIHVWDRGTGKERLHLSAHVGLVRHIAFSPDGSKMATAGGETFAPGEVKVWDTTTGQELLNLQQPHGVYQVVFSPDGKHLAAAIPFDDCTKVWDASSGTELLSLKQDAVHPWSVAFSRDGQQLATGGIDMMIKLWHVGTGQLLKTLRGHGDDVRGLVFSPDGLRLASASHDRTVKLWDLATGQEVLTLPGSAGQVRTVAFSPDGNRLASGHEDGTVKLWDATPREARSER